MFLKIAARNVKRQVGNYLIYFITVSLTVALMFAVNSVIYSPELQAQASSFQELSNGLTMFSVFLSLIIIFVLGYANSFMLKLRKREFGTYLTLGMTRGNILRIFILETLILAVVALGTGILLGLLVYQGLMMAVTALLELPFVFSSYSLSGLWLTVVLMGVVFILSSLSSGVYLRRASVYNLLHGARKVEKAIKFPFLWLLCALLSGYAIAVACVLLYRSVEETALSSGDSGMATMMLSLGLLAVSLLLFHIGLARSVTFMFQKNKQFCSQGTNAFVLRQISGKLNSNSVMLGAVALLTVFALVSANLAFVIKVSNEESIEYNYLYDVSGFQSLAEESPVSLEEGRAVIQEQAGIKEEVSYTLYTTGSNYLHSFTSWHYDNLYDAFISLSDFNRLYASRLESPLTLEEGTFALATDYRRMKTFDFSGAALTLGDKTYRPGPVMSELPMLNYVYFLAVLPDEAVAGLTPTEKGVAYNVQNQDYNGEALYNALSFPNTMEYEGGSVTFYGSDYRVKDYARQQQIGSSAIILVGMLYLGLVLLLMAMAVLALKTLTGMSEDRQRYSLLSRLGTNARQQSQTLYRQTGVFFFLPLIVPLILCVPTGIVCAHLCQLLGMPSLIPTVTLLTAVCAAVFTAIYLLYFTAVHQITKRNILS